MPSPLTFLKSLTSHKHEPATAPVPTKGILRRNPAKLKKSIRHAPDLRPERDKNISVNSNSPLDKHHEVERKSDCGFILFFTLV
jgi:hypothetical protein